MSSEARQVLDHGSVRLIETWGSAHAGAVRRDGCMSGATTTIRVPIGGRVGEEWDVPRGFGAAYLRAAKLDLACVGDGKPGEVIDGVIAVLELIGYTATREQVAGWDLRRRVEAMIYAATEHARAGDSPVRRHPRPAWMPERPWQGSGTGAFSGPGPTEIP